MALFLKKLYHKARNLKRCIETSMTRLGDLLLFRQFLKHWETILWPKFKSTFWQFVQWCHFLQLSTENVLGDFWATFTQNF